MRKSTFLMAALILIFVGISSFLGYGAEEKAKTDREKIEELHQTDTKASMANDVDTLLSLWTDDGVMIRPGGEPVIGKKALTQAMGSYREQLKNITITQYVIDFKEVTIIGDHAYEWGEFHHKYFTKDNPGKEFEQKGRLMRILRRQPDGQWKVARAIWTVDVVD
jgi:uncharacterized protein (TIGR02246 family)